MEFPDSKLSVYEAEKMASFSSIAIERIDPDQPHRFVQTGAPQWGDWSCRICGGSRRLPVHVEPLGGWR
jgi:hypothetical protein